MVYDMHDTSCQYTPNTKKLWPQDQTARAYARCISHEMHAGFATLRKLMPFAPNQTLTVSLTPELEMDIKRISMPLKIRLYPIIAVLFSAILSLKTGCNYEFCCCFSTGWIASSSSTERSAFANSGV